MGVRFRQRPPGRHGLYWQQIFDLIFNMLGHAATIDTTS